MLPWLKQLFSSRTGQLVAAKIVAVLAVFGLRQQARNEGRRDAEHRHDKARREAEDETRERIRNAEREIQDEKADRGGDPDADAEWLRKYADRD